MADQFCGASMIHSAPVNTSESGQTLLQVCGHCAAQCVRINSLPCSHALCNEQLKSKQSEVERKEEILAQLHERYSAAKPASPSVRSGKHKSETDATEKPRRLDVSRGSLEVKVWQRSFCRIMDTCREQDLWQQTSRSCNLYTQEQHTALCMLLCICGSCCLHCS